MNLIKSLTIVFLVGMSALAEAKLLQIIHTNDLHSFFSGSRNGLGGYARIKTLADQLRADAEKKNIKTLWLDAGDFGEGSSYYFSNNGVDALRALDLLGVDVTVLGNHDFILGGFELSRQIKKAKLKAKILSANLRGKATLGLAGKIRSSLDYDLGGLKVRIFGLTTTEIHYQYPLLPNGFISSSHNAGVSMAEKSQRDDVDLLIGLTHIGLEKDMHLASKTFSVDFIIGGHSHTRLSQPKLVKNLHGELTPVFQTGAWGQALGSLLIDVQGDGDYQIIDYKLYDISRDIPEDVDVRTFVDGAHRARERYFNRRWDEVIGFSEIPLTGIYNGRVRNPQSCWSRHIARLTRTTAKAQIGLQLDIFQGEEIPAGVIHFGDLIDNFPHFRKWGDKGWNITRATVSGFLLNQILKGLSKGNEPFDVTLDGVDVPDQGGRLIPFNNKKHDPELALVNGERISNKKFYTIGLPSEIAFGIGKFSPLLLDLLLANSKTIPDSYFWPLFENYLKRNSPLKCLE